MDRWSTKENEFKLYFYYTLGQSKEREVSSKLSFLTLMTLTFGNLKLIFYFMKLFKQYFQVIINLSVNFK